MPSRALRQDEQAQDDKCGDHGGGEWPAEVQTARGHRFIQKVANGGAKWSGKDKGSPKEQNARNIGPEIKGSDNSQACSKDQRAAFIPETGVGHPVTEGGAERLRKGNGRPVEAFHFRGGHRVHRDCTLRPIPKSEYNQQAHEQQRAAASVADTQRTICKVRHGSAKGRGRDDRGPIKKRVEFLRHNLRDHQHDEEAKEKRGSSQISPVESHRDGITTGLAQRGCSDLDDPKPKGDLGNLAEASAHSIHRVHWSISSEKK